MKPKIIHLVLGKANPNRMNGVNKVAHNHAVHMHQLGYDVEIWGITKTPDGEVIDREVPTRLFRQQPFYRDLDPQLLYAISKTTKNTIFHIHGAFIPDFYKMSRMLVDMKRNYVYTPHGAFNKIALEKSKWVKKIYIQRYEKTMLKDALKVHFLGQSEFDHIDKIIKLSNKVIIPNGQSFEELDFEFHKMQRKQVPVFGFCGRLDLYYKGLDMLVDGFASYVKKGGLGELWMIGDGEDRKTLEEQVKMHGVEERVNFMGARYGKDKLNRIANMDVFCHPSRSEGSPTAVLEAAALSRPLMVSTATNVGQIVEANGCGIHLHQTTAKTIEKACFDFQKLFQNNQSESMGCCARMLVEKEFNWLNISSRLIQIYEQK
jgi:glycosyltransferase involved in cell wall biosynthesis